MPGRLRQRADVRLDGEYFEDLDTAKVDAILERVRTRDQGGAS